jgi:hypothetical protein
MIRYSSGLKAKDTGTDKEMARLTVFSLALVAMVLGATFRGVEAQTIPSNYAFFENRQEAGFFVGTTGQSTGQFEYGPKSGLVMGARYGLHLGGPFGLEGVVGYQPTTRNIVDPTREEGDLVVDETDADLLGLDARLRFSLTGDRSWRGLHPFIFLGVGVATDLAGDSEKDALLLPDDQFEFGTKFMAPLGGGFRWFLSDRFLVRGDLTILMYQLKAPQGFLDPARGFQGVGEKEWVSGTGFSVGLGYTF